MNEDALASVDERTVILIIKCLRGVNAPLHREVVAAASEERLFRRDGGESGHEARSARACASAATRPDSECDRGDPEYEQQPAHVSARPVAGSIDCVAPAMLVRISWPPISSAAPTTSVCARRHFTSPSERIAQVSTSL